MHLRPIISASTLVKNDFSIHENYIEQYAYDIDFQDVYASLSEGNQEKAYHMHKFFFSFGKAMYSTRREATCHERSSFISYR